MPEPNAGPTRTSGSLRGAGQQRLAPTWRSIGTQPEQSGVLPLAQGIEDLARGTCSATNSRFSFVSLIRLKH
jgi:hypothetical protein